MKKVLSVLLLSLGFCCSCAQIQTTKQGIPSLIPWPASLEAQSGSFNIDADTPICAGEGTENEAQQLKRVLKSLVNLDLMVKKCSGQGIGLLLAETEKSKNPESYTLEVADSGVSISASARAGVYYGAMTFAQLLSSERFKNNKKVNNSVTQLDGLHIEDYPRYQWRGLMLDPARHFLPVDNVKKVIDQMGQLKFNTLHLHLSDDQGWRLEIKRYPRLTEVGAWRTPPATGSLADNAKKYGGFYTQDDIRDIVSYAAQRHITIVPELDMPGHAQAAVAAYPHIIGVNSDAPKSRPDVSHDWGINPYLFSTRKESMDFIKHVLDEVIELFPGNYVHLGGDEAVKDQWEASPAIQAQMKALGIASEKEMQSWFMSELGEYLHARGKRMLGWDEILDGGVPATATVMSWRGTAGAITAARLGHDVVVSPAPVLYLDNLQSRRGDEPAGRLAITTLSSVYKFEITPHVLNTEQQRHILGAQANLWSEYLLSPWYVERAAFPRAGAVAEILWTKSSDLSWASFLARTADQMERYRRQSIAAADSAFAVDFGLSKGRNVALETGKSEFMLSNQANFGDIRYTLDDTEPTVRSTAYAAPFIIETGTRVKAATFDSKGRMLADVRTYDFSKQTLRTRESNQLRPCYGGDFGLRVPLTADSPAASPVYDVDIFHDCFVYPSANLQGISTLSVESAILARNYGLAHDAHKVKSYPNQTPFGEMVVYKDVCETGDELARVALTDPAATPQRKTLEADLLPVDGTHDLCIVFTAPLSGPFYAIERAHLQ